jgi:hypothetical protein
VRAPALVALTLGSLALPLLVQAAAFKQTKQTSRVIYYASKGRTVDVPRTEAFLDRLATLFGPAPDGRRLAYYLHDSKRVAQPQGGAPAIGLTDLATLRIDSVRAYHPHELVHAVAGRLGRPPVFFAEGLAVALTSGGKWYGEDLDAVARRALDANPSLEPFLARFTEQEPDVAYAVAGSMIGYLLDRDGIEAMLAFLRGCGSGAERYERAFQQAYGRTVARATIEWQQSLRQPTRSARAWQDPDSWPGALQRGGTVPASTQQLAQLGALSSEPALAEQSLLAR